MTFIQSIRRSVGRGRGTADAAASVLDDPSRADALPLATGPAVEISPSDPLFAFLQSATGVVEVDRLTLDSPALVELRAAGVKIVVPLVAQGELIGALYLGPRLSDQDYSTDDRKLLSTLAAQAAPAIRVAQLVREQEARQHPVIRRAQDVFGAALKEIKTS